MSLLEINKVQIKLMNKVSELPVMKSCCKTCPFRKTDKGMFQDSDLANKVIERNIFKSQQICHGTEGKNREPNNRCKGYYDYSLEIYEKIFDKDKIHDVLNNPDYNK